MNDVSHPEAQLARSATQDAATHFENLLRRGKYDITMDPHHLCIVSVPKLSWTLTGTELSDLHALGVSADCFSVHFYAVAHIMGVHFRAGEWGQYPRCGSVITCVMDVGDNVYQSFYGRVRKFLVVDGDDSPGYASVHWFSRPTYPDDTPLVVRVGEDGSFVDKTFGSIVSICDIDPSRVMVEYDSHPDTYYVMRDSGYDTTEKS